MRPGGDDVENCRLKGLIHSETLTKERKLQRSVTDCCCVVVLTCDGTVLICAAL